MDGQLFGGIARAHLSHLQSGGLAGASGSAGVPPAKPRLRAARPHSSLLPSRSYRGRFAPKRAWGLGKRMAFPASLTHRKTKAAGGSPCAFHPNVARFIRPSDRPCRISRRRSPRDSPSCVRNHNRPKRMPKRSHRRLDLHGRILRRPPATLRRRRPLHAIPKSDRRARPLSRR